MNNPSGKGIPRKYDFANIPIGESVLIDDTARNVRQAVYFWQKQLQIKLKTKTTTKGIRVWRKS